MGDKCQTEKVPKTIRVEEVFFYIPSPCTDFDPSDGLTYGDADPYVAFYYNNVKKFDTRNQASENKSYATLNIDFTFDNTDRVWEVRYYDKDATTDQLIGTYTFKPYDSTRSPNFPQTIQAIELEQHCTKGNFSDGLDTRLFLNRVTYTY